MLKIIANSLVSAVLILQLSGCGTPGGDDSGNRGSTISAAPAGNGSALLSWMPPSDNTDGSNLVDLAGYRIYYGTTSGSYSETVDLNTPGVSSFLVENLGDAEWFFVMTAYTSSGIESAYTPEVSAVIASI